MSDQVIRDSISLITGPDFYQDEKLIPILWHAGEPLVAPIEYYRHVLEVIKDAAPGYRIKQTFQTNGTLINSDWCNFFVENDCDVGISIDGPAALNDKNRKFRNGNGSYIKIIEGAKLLHSSNIPFGALVVLTRDSLKIPDDIFYTLVHNNISSVGFNIEEIEGININTSMNDPDFYDDVLFFFERIFSINETLDYPIHVREFDEVVFYMSELRRDPNFTPSQSEQRPFALVTIDHLGEISTFSPELATDPNRKWRLGNVRNGNRLSSVIDESLFSTMNKDIIEGIRNCKDTCKYFSLCGGGSPSSKFYETGSFSATTTRQCTFYRKSIIDASISHALHRQRKSSKYIPLRE